MKTDLGTGYIIEGFDSRTKAFMFKDELCIAGEQLPYIYIGRTSKIAEKIAKKILKLHPYSVEKYPVYFEYDNIDLELDNNKMYHDKKDSVYKNTRNDYLYDWEISIESACNQEYCIIYKKE